MLFKRKKAPAKESEAEAVETPAASPAPAPSSPDSAPTPGPKPARPPEISREAGAKFDPSTFNTASMPAVTAATGRGPLADPQTLAARPKTQPALAAILEEAGVVSSREDAEDLIRRGDEAAQSLKRSIVEQGFAPEEDMLEAMAVRFDMDHVALRDIDVTPELLGVMDIRIAKKYKVFPVSAEDGRVVVALSDPTNVEACDELSVALNKEVTAVLASADEIERYIERYYEGDQIGRIYDEFTQEGVNPYTKSLEEYETIDLDSQETSSLPPAVRFVDLIFKQAVHEGASDIHIEPDRRGVNLRFRIDGVLHELPRPPRVWQNYIISRLKVQAGMDLAEKRVPQDGRIKLTLPEKNLDLRVSCLPSIFGETIVMRLLDQSDVLMGLEDVGFLPDTVADFERLIRSPDGIILMTGPTGSGKTTTLYSALTTLNSPEAKLITIEDPVEYQLSGINQIQVNEEVGLNFATGLRSMLRLAPDVIMVGEIRDIETAEIAIRSALTGHLVFSTLHTNDASTAPIRLIDMGVKPFLVASSIHAVIAQRLVRRICGNCKAPSSLPTEAFFEMGVDANIYQDTVFYKGAGCDRCSDSGYRGRTAIHEILENTPELRKMIIRSESAMKIKRAGVANGMRTLRQDGWEKIVLGQTTVQEVMKITQMD